MISMLMIGEPLKINSHMSERNIRNPEGGRTRIEKYADFPFHPPLKKR